MLLRCTIFLAASPRRVATAPLPDDGKADQPQQSDTEPTLAHGRGAAQVVRELARRVSRLASRTTN
jgi:hypothetical protein